MLYYDRIGVSEGMMLIRQAKQKSVLFVTIGNFLNKGFKFPPFVFNGCHYLLVMSMNLRNIVILNIKGADYCCSISRISKIEAINLMQNIGLPEKSGTLYNIIITSL